MRLTRSLLLALWAGGLVSIGGLVAPVLFHVLDDRPLAGRLAGECFRVATLASLLLAPVIAWLPAGAPAARVTGRERLGVLAPAVLLAISEWLVRPALEAARGVAGSVPRAFIAWHAVSTLLYAAATVLVVAALVAALRR